MDYKHLLHKKVRYLAEEFQAKKFNKGEIKFSSSSLRDPHIVKILNLIATTKGVSVKELENHINQEMTMFDFMNGSSPILYETIRKNLVEDQTFTLFQKANIPVPTAPKFSNVIFQNLIRYVRADHKKFLPLKGFLDPRRIANPKIVYIDGPTENTQSPNSIYKDVPTAAATPTGDFIFNVKFCQKLLDYAHIKQLKPKGKKYINNGGNIPPEWSYIEFVIMHEFMHYSEDDFYYQGIIPNANPKIINWVGDFRSNYLLVKSGYEQLPMGLFNDDINYDRQSSYYEMYKIIEDEFKKLGKDQQEKISEILDGMSDDHKPGQADGKEKIESGEIDTSKTKPGDIDKNGKRIQAEVGQGKEVAPGEQDKGEEGKDPSGKNAPEGTRQKGGSNREVDYTKIRPQFNWRTLVDRFLKSAIPHMQETYAKPHRRSAASIHTAAQSGAAAIKPAEKLSDKVDLNLLFVLDCSGSMIPILPVVFSEATKLLKDQRFDRSEVYVMKFSSSHELYRGIFAKNKAHRITNIAEKQSNVYETTMAAVFGSAQGGGTEITPESAKDIATLCARGYNALIVTDTDILWGHNLPLTLELIKKYPKQIFLVMKDRDNYIAWRQKTGIGTANITHF